MSGFGVRVHSLLVVDRQDEFSRVLPFVGLGSIKMVATVAVCSLVTPSSSCCRRGHVCQQSGNAFRLRRDMFLHSFFLVDFLCYRRSHGLRRHHGIVERLTLPVFNLFMSLVLSSIQKHWVIRFQGLQMLKVHALAM